MRRLISPRKRCCPWTAMTRFSAPYPCTMATAPDSTTKKSLPSSPAAKSTSPGSTARTLPRLRSRARWSSSRRGKAPLRSTASETPAPIGPATAPANPGGTCPPSLFVVLHRVGRARLSVVGVEPELFAGPALAQQVPAPIELDLHLAQPIPISLEGFGIGAVPLLAATQPLLLRHQPLDPGGNALVAHELILRCAPGFTGSSVAPHRRSAGWPWRSERAERRRRGRRPRRRPRGCRASQPGRESRARRCPRGALPGSSP